MADGEGADVHSNTKVNVNWFNVNIPTILAVAAVGWGIASYISDINSRLGENERSRVSQGVQAEKQFETIKATLDELDNLPLRMTTVESQLLSTNQRLDRLVENLTGSVENLRREVNSVGTKVEVLSSKIDGLTPEKRAAIREGQGAASLDNTSQPPARLMK